MNQKKLKKCFQTLAIFALAFCAGGLAAKLEQKYVTPKSIPTSASGNWGLSFQEEGKPPVTDVSSEELGKIRCLFCKTNR